MSASEKLRALANPPMPFEPDFDKRYTEHHELSLAFQDALPLIADVVEAAERGRDRSILIEEHISTIEKVAWRVDDAQALNSSITALREHLEGGDE